MVRNVACRGGTRGGLGGCSPHSEYASPHRKVKAIFRRIFGSCRKIPGATPGYLVGLQAGKIRPLEYLNDLFSGRMLDSRSPVVSRMHVSGLMFSEPQKT